MFPSTSARPAHVGDCRTIVADTASTSLSLPARRLGRDEPERRRHRDGEPGVEGNEDPRRPGEENQAMHPVPYEVGRITGLACAHSQDVFQPGEGTNNSKQSLRQNQSDRSEVKYAKPEIPRPPGPEGRANQNRDEAEDHKSNISRVSEDDRIRKQAPAHGTDHGSLLDHRSKLSLQAG